jgi:hypothetical protein
VKSWVYFIQEGADGPIKIGHTKNCPTMRLNVLQHGNARPLRFIGLVRGGFKDERKWHSRFKAHRLEREWFSPAPELLADISSACITGSALERQIVDFYRRGRAYGPKLQALHAWMAETGHTSASLAALIGWKFVWVRNAVEGRNNHDGVGMFLAAAIAKASGGRLKIKNLCNYGEGETTLVLQRLLKAEAERQAVSA